MLQFDKSAATNNNAVWIETVNTSSGYYDDLELQYSQSYDRSSGSFDLSTYSAPNQYRHWLVITNSGSLAPIPSGQYDIEIYRKSGIGDGRWAFTDQVWGTTDQKWDTFGESVAVGLALYKDRAYISGSNETSIKQYLSPNENGKYTTYNG